MNILERGRACLQSRPALAERSTWDWQRCPQCGSRLTIKHGSYTRRPGVFTGRQRVRGQRHLCHAGTKSYAEQAALLVRGSWYSREVRRRAVDHWVHGRLSLRRSWLGRQERWRRWRPLDTTPPGEPCDLAASTVPRWLDCAGGVAPARVPGQLQDIAQREAWGTAGLWARLRGGATRVVLLLADSVTGLLWPPLVAEREDLAAPWPRLFARARLAGLDWPRLRGVTSEGAPGLSVFGGQTLAWVQQQRCVWRRWRTLAGQLAHEAAQVAAGAVAAVVREQVRTALVALLPGVLEAQSYAQAAAARVLLRSHPQGPVISQFLNEQLDHILVHRVAYYAGLHRVTPEWPKVARLSPPPQLRPPSWRRPAFGAGRPGLGQLPQLRARAMAV